MPFLIAHRGASSEAPENTLHSIRRAIELNVDFIEIDIHLTRDGVPVVIHDDTLARTVFPSSEVKIKDLSLEEIQTYDAGSWFHSSFATTKIPTLDQALQLNRGPIGLMIEIKQDESDPEKIVEATLDSLQRMRPKQQGSILLGSFSPQILQILQRKKSPFPLIGIIEELPMLSAMQEMHFQHLAIWYRLLAPELVSTLLKADIKIWTFTVDQVETAQILLSMGIEGIITNHPRDLIRNIKSSSRGE